MTDPRPSIAELQQTDWSEAALLSDEMVALRAAAPVLLEIAAAALALLAQERVEERVRCAAATAPLAQMSPDWDGVGREAAKLRKCHDAYHAALAKVRP